MSTNDLDRRNFLAEVSAERNGCVACDCIVGKSRSGSQPGTEEEEKPIIKRKLAGKNRPRDSCCQFWCSGSDSPALVVLAMKEGIVLFDTANGYQAERIEEMLGDVLKDYPRDSFILATKVPPEERSESTGLLGEKSTRHYILEKLDISLKRLKMEYVDILYICMDFIT